MRTLFYQPLCPFSRKVRIFLGECRLDFQGIVEPVWKEREEFLELNPLGQVPVLVDLNHRPISDSSVICEYLDETYNENHSFVGKTILGRSEVRRIVSWFDGKFNGQVTHNLVFEKAFKRAFGLGGPDSQVIRKGNQALQGHLEYMTFLLERRHWLGGDDFSLGDMAGAAHLSALDYMGHVNWEKYPEVKEWYGRIKCRPSMRPLLQDVIPGLTPASHYKDIDF
jgi:glutathione S-transferase